MGARETVFQSRESLFFSAYLHWNVEGGGVGGGKINIVNRFRGFCYVYLNEISFKHLKSRIYRSIYRPSTGLTWLAVIVVAPFKRRRNHSLETFCTVIKPAWNERMYTVHYKRVSVFEHTQRRALCVGKLSTPAWNFALSCWVNNTRNRLQPAHGADTKREAARFACCCCLSLFLSIPFCARNYLRTQHLGRGEQQKNQQKQIWGKRTTTLYDPSL